MKLTIQTEAGELELQAPPERTLLEAIRTGARGNSAAARVLSGFSAPCGGAGTCGGCKLLLKTATGEREVLACRTRVQDGMQLRLPEAPPLTVHVSEPEAAPRPAADSGSFGIACDLGTTTVVCSLVALPEGTTIGTLGEGNTQRAWGSDVISRIRASVDGSLSAMTEVIRAQLSRMILQLCENAEVPLAALTGMTVAGNTIMCHLLAGLPPDGMGAAPFTPVSLFGFGTPIPARSLSLPFDGTVCLLPAVSAFVGGDITADLLAADMDRTKTPTLLIDVGTNGEMALGCGEHFLCCSTAAGPAFEGAEITCGMTAAPGAISEVRWSENGPVCTVLGGVAPRGLCGSGLIDAVAMLLNIHAVDETGRMADPTDEDEDIPPEIRPFLFLTETEAPAFRLTDRVFVTQGDIRKLQLGKGAIAAGARVLRERYSAEHPGTEIGALLLSGGFGSSIRPESAARIGLIPPELLPVTHAPGNTALSGAKQALLSVEAGSRLESLRRNMEYLELSGMAAFAEYYVDAMLFPETPEPEAD